jgi:hypothetical protein
MTMLDSLKAEGATHTHRRSPDVMFVYRPARSFAGLWGQKVIIRRDEAWHLGEPWILCDSLPEDARSLAGETL